MSEVSPKPKNLAYAVRISADNTEIIAALKEVEETIDRIQEKADRLKATLSECCASADFPT